MPPDVSLGEALAYYRTDLGMTQDEVALQLGTSQGVISSWEKNEHRPSPKFLHALAQLYNQPYADFRSRLSLNRNDVLGIPARLVRLWRRLGNVADPEVADRVLDLLAAIVGLVEAIYDIILNPHE